jgi:hypothetical protein
MGVSTAARTNAWWVTFGDKGARSICSCSLRSAGEPFQITPSLKAGAKVRSIRLVDSDHNIDCKFDGFGPMGH